MRVLKWAALLVAMVVLVALTGCGPRAQNPRDRYPAPELPEWVYIEIEQNQELLFTGPQGVTQTVRLATWCTSIQSSCLAGTPELAVEPYAQPREAVWDGLAGFKVKMFWPAVGVLGIYYQGEGWSLQENQQPSTPTPAVTLETVPAGTDIEFEKGYMAACKRGAVTQNIWMTMYVIQSGFPVVGAPPLDNSGAAKKGVYTAQSGTLRITATDQRFTIRSDEKWECTKEALPSAP